METAICARLPLSPNHIFNQKPGDRSSLYKGQFTNRGILLTVLATAPGKGGGVLDRPTTEKATPGRESEFDLRVTSTVTSGSTSSLYEPLDELESDKITWSSTPHPTVHPDNLKKKKISPPYRVLLHNDDFNKREYVVQVLMKVIPGMTLDIAVNVMQEAHLNGLAVVIICAQADAEDHCMQLRGSGLLSSIEPAGSGC